jgi:phosphinothricin acetyltransferase
MPGKIRLAREDDAAAVQAIYAPYVRETAISFETEPPSVDEMLARMQRVMAKHAGLVCEDAAGEVAGYAYGGVHRARAAYRWSVEVTVYNRLDMHRRGLGRALYTPLLEMLRRQGYASAYGGITLPNDASVGLHKAMGFSDVGVFPNVGYKFGKWHSVAWMSRELGRYAETPAEPRPLHETLSPEEIERLCADGSALLRL